MDRVAVSNRIVVVGASTGGVDALRELVRRLPADLRATVLVVLHVPASARSVLPELLQRVSPLAVRHAVDGESLVPRTVLVAPPDYHLLVHDGHVRLTHGARENGHRPAIDPLFRSAARWYGPRAISVVLTGALDDGTSGTLAVKLRGGVTMAQSPDDAVAPSMPQSAIDNVGVDRTGTIALLAEHIATLANEAVVTAETSSKPSLEEAPLEDEDMMPTTAAPEGPTSSFTCPSCHGAMWELRDGELVRYRCRVGHAYAPESMMAAQWEHVEEAVWTALRALEESEALAGRLAERAGKSGSTELVERYQERLLDAKKRAATIRELVEAFTTGRVRRQA